MKLTSNLPAVIGRLKRYQAGLPGAVRATLTDPRWESQLQHVATKTIRAQWVNETSLAKHQLYERLTPVIVRTLTRDVTERGVTWSLSQIAGVGVAAAGVVAGVNLGAAVEFNLGNRTPTGREKKFAIHEPDQQANLDAVRQAIRDFVALEKRRDERDAGLSDEQIALRLEEILGVSDRATPRARSADMEAAAANLTRAITAWLDGEGETPPVNRGAQTSAPEIAPEVLRAWLEAVLLAWRVYVEATLRLKLEVQLDKLRAKIKNELL